MESNPLIKKVWASGDLLYAAISTGSHPGGLHFMMVDGREYPVGQVSRLACDEFSLVRWVKRTERFPEPIKGFNF